MDQMGRISPMTSMDRNWKEAHSHSFISGFSKCHFFLFCLLEYLKINTKVTVRESPELEVDALSGEMTSSLVNGKA